MSKKVFLGVAIFSLLAVAVTAEAQQAKKVPRIGYVSASGGPASPDARFEVFRQGLRDLGYIEGKNILLEVRYAEGRQDPIPSLVADLVELKVDVLLLTTLPGIRAARRKYHGTHQTHPRVKWKTAGIASGGGSENIACRSPLGCGRPRLGYCF